VARRTCQLRARSLFIYDAGFLRFWKGSDGILSLMRLHWGGRELVFLDDGPRLPRDTPTGAVAALIGMGIGMSDKVLRSALLRRLIAEIKTEE
jgi:hypothetical protein